MMLLDTAYEGFEAADLRRGVFLVDCAHVSVIFRRIFDDGRLRRGCRGRLSAVVCAAGCDGCGADCAAAAVAATTPSTAVTRSFHQYWLLHLWESTKS